MNEWRKTIALWSLVAATCLVPLRLLLSNLHDSNDSMHGLLSSLEDGLLVLAGVGFGITLTILILEYLEVRRINAEVKAYQREIKPKSPTQSIDSDYARASVELLALVARTAGEGPEARETCAWHAARLAGRYLSTHQIDDISFRTRRFGAQSQEEDRHAAILRRCTPDMLADLYAACAEVAMTPTGMGEHAEAFLEQIAEGLRIDDEQSARLTASAREEWSKRRYIRDGKTNAQARRSAAEVEAERRHNAHEAFWKTFDLEEFDDLFEELGADEPTRERTGWNNEEANCRREEALSYARLRGPDWAFEALGLTRRATLSEVKRAYHLVALRNHPDRHSSEDEEDRRRAERRFKEAVRAYQLLTGQASST